MPTDREISPLSLSLSATRTRTHTLKILFTYIRTHNASRSIVSSSFSDSIVNDDVDQCRCHKRRRYGRDHIQSGEPFGGAETSSSFGEDGDQAAQAARGQYCTGSSDQAREGKQKKRRDEMDRSSFHVSSAYVLTHVHTCSQPQFQLLKKPTTPTSLASSPPHQEMGCRTLCITIATVNVSNYIGLELFHRVRSAPQP